MNGLQIQHAARRIGDCVALADASITVEPGRVRALVGENGAGKSTLIRVACGLVAPDSGTLVIDGRTMTGGDPRAMDAAGVGVVHQHFMLVEPMTVAENVALGREPRRGPFGLWFDRASVRARVRELGAQYGLPVDPDARIESLSVGERQRVELLKVLYRGARYVLLDEPTAVLSPGEVRSLLDVVRGLARAGAGVLLVSHKLDEVMAVADTVTVLRRGRVVLEGACGPTGVTAEAIGRAVVGGELATLRPARASTVEPREALTVHEARAPGLRGVSLSIRAGEVLGVAGVEGNGQVPLAHAIAGLRRLDAGEVRLGGVDTATWSVGRRRANGLGYVPEDREATGLLPRLSIAENLALGDPRIAAGGAWSVSPEAMRLAARALIDRFAIRPPDPDASVATLSGGNAQKVLIAREMARTLTALVVAQPTRGVDVGAAVEIHSALRTAREQGVAVLLISSELAELRTLADRVIVMRSGAIVGEMPASEASDERLGPLMVGAAAGAPA